MSQILPKSLVPLLFETELNMRQIKKNLLIDRNFCFVIRVLIYLDLKFSNKSLSAKVIQFFVLYVIRHQYIVVF